MRKGYTGWRGKDTLPVNLILSPRSQRLARARGLSQSLSAGSSSSHREGCMGYSDAMSHNHNGAMEAMTYNASLQAPVPAQRTEIQSSILIQSEHHVNVRLHLMVEHVELRIEFHLDVSRERDVSSILSRGKGIVLVAREIRVWEGPVQLTRLPLLVSQFETVLGDFLGRLAEEEHIVLEEHLQSFQDIPLSVFDGSRLSSSKPSRRRERNGTFAVRVHLSARDGDQRM